MNCPICNTTEIYKHEFVTDNYGPEPIVTSIFHTVQFGKYDTPEPGEYECVNGHEFIVNNLDE